MHAERTPGIGVARVERRRGVIGQNPAEGRPERRDIAIRGEVLRDTLEGALRAGDLRTARIVDVEVREQMHSGIKWRHC